MALICMPYMPLRRPSSALAVIAATPEPPPATTPMKANCEPPLNRRRLNTMVCQKSKPDATDKAPKDTPYRPVAMLRDSATLNAGDSLSLVAAGLPLISAGSRTRG
ncbi:hypothetical protein D3C73_1512220 [compost metagenome]